MKDELIWWGGERTSSAWERTEVTPPQHWTRKGSSRTPHAAWLLLNNDADAFDGWPRLEYSEGSGS